jgi:hypothetical protein
MWHGHGDFSMMNTKGRLATILIALALFGCKGPVQTSAASAGEGANGGASSASSSSGGTRVEVVKDDTLNNMDAVEVRIPSNWKFQGVLFQPGNCVQTTYTVWRATNPDGKTFAERMPVLGWTYGSGTLYASLPKNGCLPMNGAMTAVDFAKYMTGVLHVQAVDVEPFPPAWEAQLEQESAQAHQKAQGANAVVQFMNGSTQMKGNLRVVIKCTENVTPAPRVLSPTPPVHMITKGTPTVIDHCEANMQYLTSPVNEYAGWLQRWSAPGMGNGQGILAWQDAWEQRYERNLQQQTTAFINGSNARFNTEQEGYRRQAAVQQQMHNEFMDTMQRGTEMSMQRTSDAMNARTTAASDWVDYALDRKTVMDTNTGQIYKTGNQITPGGAAVQVHGNGQQY